MSDIVPVEVLNPFRGRSVYVNDREHPVVTIEAPTPKAWQIVLNSPVDWQLEAAFEKDALEGRRFRTIRAAMQAASERIKESGSDTSADFVRLSHGREWLTLDRRWRFFLPTEGGWTIHSHGGADWELNEQRLLAHGLASHQVSFQTLRQARQALALFLSAAST